MMHLSGSQRVYTDEMIILTQVQFLILMLTWFLAATGTKVFDGDAGQTSALT